MPKQQPMHVYEFPGGLIIETSQRKARARLKQHLKQQDDPDGSDGPVGVHRVPDRRVLKLTMDGDDEVRITAGRYANAFHQPTIIRDL